jgi:hypothetical protein
MCGQEMVQRTPDALPKGIADEKIAFGVAIPVVAMPSVG